MQVVVGLVGAILGGLFGGLGYVCDDPFPTSYRVNARS